LLKLILTQVTCIFNVTELLRLYPFLAAFIIRMWLFLTLCFIIIFSVFLF